MEISFAPELEAKLNRIAAQTGKGADQIVKELVATISITTNGSGKKWRRVLLLSIGASPSLTKRCVTKWSEFSARDEVPLVA